MLERFLRDEYYVISTSFESADDIFEDNEKFARGFLEKISDEMEMKGFPAELVNLRIMWAMWETGSTDHRRGG